MRCPAVLSLRRFRHEWCSTETILWWGVGILRESLVWTTVGPLKNGRHTCRKRRTKCYNSFKHCGCRSPERLNNICTQIAWKESLVRMLRKRNATKRVRHLSQILLTKTRGAFRTPQIMEKGAEHWWLGSTGGNIVFPRPLSLQFSISERSYCHLRPFLRRGEQVFIRREMTGTGCESLIFTLKRKRESSKK